MQEILLKGDTLYQWDTDRQIELNPQDGHTVDEVHFMNPKGATTYIVSPKEGVADIPNILLQRPNKLKVFAVMHTENGQRTVSENTFDVVMRQKPSNYVYTETEVLTWKYLDERLSNLEKGGASEEQIAQAVRDYLLENPITETDPTIPAWAKQPTKPTYTADEVGALSQDELQSGIDEALQQAKDSGEFKGEDGKDGADGYTPQKGVDYFTEADKEELVSAVLGAMPLWEGGAY